MAYFFNVAFDDYKAFRTRRMIMVKSYVRLTSGSVNECTETYSARTVE